MFRQVSSLLAAVCLWSFSSQAFAQTQPPRVSITTATLNWAWTKGTNDPGTNTFRVKCGTVSGVYTLTKDTGNIMAMTYPVSGIITAPNTYFCVVSAVATGATPPLESSNSNEVTFRGVYNPETPSTLSVAP